MSNVPSSAYKAADLPPPQTLSKEEEEEEDYRMQLLLLDQQNKGREGYVPAITDATKLPRQQHGVVSNFLVDGEGLLTCHACVVKTYESDRSLWPDLKKRVHRPVPVEWRTGPDMHQCFCGWFSMMPEELVRHVEMEMEGEGKGDDEVMAGLLRRIAEVDMHEECRGKLVAFVTKEK